MRVIPEVTGNDGSRHHPGDLSTAQKLAGPSDPATNARYDQRGEKAMRETAFHLHAPTSGE